MVQDGTGHLATPRRGSLLRRTSSVAPPQGIEVDGAVGGGEHHRRDDVDELRVHHGRRNEVGPLHQSAAGAGGGPGVVLVGRRPELGGPGVAASFQQGRGRRSEGVFVVLLGKAHKFLRRGGREGPRQREEPGIVEVRLPGAAERHDFGRVGFLLLFRKTSSPWPQGLGVVVPFKCHRLQRHQRPAPEPEHLRQERRVAGAAAFRGPKPRRGGLPRIEGHRQRLGQQRIVVVVLLLIVVVGGGLSLLRSSGVVAVEQRRFVLEAPAVG
mmetsp:Transcript_24586/g.79462  ORF Transcript_24586/g.79462 Transcript_24586/m.79462 type:complete len:268 (-) Transcript_24586:2161-2964(-)